MSVRRVWITKRKTGKRYEYWQARVMVNGRRASALRGTWASAKQAEDDLTSALRASGLEGARESVRVATVQDLLVAYGEDLEARGKSRAVVMLPAYLIASMRTSSPKLLAVPVGQVADAHLFAYRKAREAQRRAPATINRDFRTLRAALKRARPAYRFPAGVMFPEDETRVRWLEPGQRRALFAALRQPYRDIAKLASLTLMRITETLTLRRGQIHPHQRVILLPRAKGGPRSVILGREALVIIRRHLLRGGPCLFPSPHDGGPLSREHVGRVFRAAAARVGLEDFHFHDLRHHGATMALNAGFSAPIVQALGGWKTERMMRRYAAITDRTLRAAAEAAGGNTRRWSARQVRVRS